jgi:hypothetical protein
VVVLLLFENLFLQFVDLRSLKVNLGLELFFGLAFSCLDFPCMHYFDLFSFFLQVVYLFLEHFNVQFELLRYFDVVANFGL